MIMNVRWLNATSTLLPNSLSRHLNMHEWGWVCSLISLPSSCLDHGAMVI